MTEETVEARRLDYSEPPPGYVMRFEDSSLENGSGPPLWWWGDPGYRASIGTEAECLAAAWAHYKAHNDPPGLTTRRGPHGAGFIIGERNSPIYGAHDSDEAARATAWAWHDRRLVLVERLEAEGVQVDFWPRVLTWSDDSCTRVEAWLPTASASTDDEFPEVLRA